MTGATTAIDMKRVHSQLREFSFPVEVQERCLNIWVLAEKAREPGISYEEALEVLHDIIWEASTLRGFADSEIRRGK